MCVVYGLSGCEANLLSIDGPDVSAAAYATGAAPPLWGWLFFFLVCYAARIDFQHGSYAFGTMLFWSQMK